MSTVQIFKLEHVDFSPSSAFHQYPFICMKIFTLLTPSFAKSTWIKASAKYITVHVYCYLKCMIP